jgi:hypothetical protein
MFLLVLFSELSCNDGVAGIFKTTCHANESKTNCLPISAEVLSAVDSRLKMDECLPRLHVVTPQGEIRIGWDAVTTFRIVVPIVEG